MKKVTTICCVLIMCLWARVQAKESARIGDPTVTLPTGTIKGVQIRDRDYDNTIERYMGIPYAVPPVGSLRFQPPQTYTGSGNIDGSLEFDAYNSKMCLQANVSNPTVTHGSEDCLYLNVWVPGGVYEARKEVLPVMVFIHGGMNVYGSSWGPTMYGERLQDMQKISLHGNVIGISLNYRLGPFGFFSTGDDSAPGNYGMLDQVMALQWIQANIWAFGGNPNQITIFGQGSGGSHSTLHMMSPLSESLFNRAIAESGNVLSPWAVNHKPLDSATELAAALGCTTSTTSEMVSCVRAAPATSVATSVVSFSKGIDSILNMKWAPVVDGYFLTDLPLNLLEKIGKKDLLVGNNDMDAHAFASIDYPDINNAIGNVDVNTLKTASENMHVNTPLEVSYAIQYEYMQYTDGFLTDYTETIVYLYTDYLFTSPTYSIASKHSIQAALTGSNTFVYLYDLPARLTTGLSPSWLGADHEAEMPYIFDMPDRDLIHYYAIDQSISKAMMTYWTNFVWSGNPNSGPSAMLVPTYWTPYDVSTQPWLKIDQDLINNPSGAIHTTYRAQYTAFWTRMVPQVLASAEGVCDPDQNTDSGSLKKRRTYLDNTRDIASECGTTDDWVRQTNYGCVRGDSSSWNGITVGRYRGIRYTAPQNNNTRFMQPQPPSSFSGIQDATKFGKICPQNPYDETSMDEDCLFLNVYVPTDASLPNNQVQSGKYAVMIYVHGSDYMTGSANDYDGTVLAAYKNIIVVTMNYRLGALGFYSSGDRFARGDWALWDQHAAFQWVKDNIGYFSGDSGRITIAGSGAGSEMVHMHTLSSKTNGLKLDQAILQSGTAFTLNSYPDQSNQALQLATRTGCASISIVGDETPDCLRGVSVEDIMTAQEGSKALPPLQFAAVVDHDFLLLDPDTDMDIPTIRKWKYIMGFNNGDGTDHWSEISSATNGDDFARIIKNDFKSQFGVGTDDIQFQYTSWDIPSFNSDQTKIQENLLSVFTDYKYMAQTNQLAFVATTTAILPTTLFTDVYMYYLTYPYENEKQQSYPSWTGAMHGSDEYYLFGATVQNDEGDPITSTLGYNIMDYWGNFVQSGTPNKDEDGNKMSYSWSKYKDRDMEYITFGKSLSTGSNIQPQVSVFWTEFLPNINVTCNMPFI